jgi:hypothetical protein
MTQWGIDTLFNPGKRHMDEEKRRLQSTREEIGDSSGGKRIDLDGGKVRLAGRSDKDAPDQDAPDQDVPNPDDESAQGGETTQAEPTDKVEPTDKAEEPDEEEDSPAARARRRRRNA